MAIELLLKNVSDVHPDIRIDRISSLKRGDVVFAQDATISGWTAYETLPEFSRLIVSNATESGVAPYMEPWYVELAYQTLDYDSDNDIYLVSMYSNTPGLGTLGVINYSLLSSYLAEWNLTISGTSTNEIIFEADMREVMVSPQFWGRSTSSFVFSWVSYNSGTKVHTLKVSYSGYDPYNPAREVVREQVATSIINNGGTITKESLYGQLIECEISSSTAIDKFMVMTAEVAHKIVFARRYYINTTAMNAIQSYMENNSGNPMTTNVATLLGYINDRITEN